MKEKYSNLEEHKKLVLEEIEKALDRMIDEHKKNAVSGTISHCHSVTIALRAECQTDNGYYKICSYPEIILPK